MNAYGDDESHVEEDMPPQVLKISSHMICFNLLYLMALNVFWFKVMRTKKKERKSCVINLPFKQCIIIIIIIIIIVIVIVIIIIIIIIIIIMYSCADPFLQEHLRFSRA